MYRITPRVQIGVEYNPKADDVNPLLNVNLVNETRKVPAVIFGTSSDRIGTPKGHSVFLTLSKDMKRWTGLPIAPYAGATYGTYDHRTRAIGGTLIRFPHHLSSLLMFDGVHVHPTLTFPFRDHSFTLLMIRGRDPGFSYSISF